MNTVFTEQEIKNMLHGFIEQKTKDSDNHYKVGLTPINWKAINQVSRYLDWNNKEQVAIWRHVIREQFLVCPLCYEDMRGYGLEDAYMACFTVDCIDEMNNVYHVESGEVAGRFE